jgi:hypothetical protein
VRPPCGGFRLGVERRTDSAGAAHFDELAAGEYLVVPVEPTAGTRTTVEIAAPVPMTSKQADVALHMVRGAASAGVGGGLVPVHILC